MADAVVVVFADEVADDCTRVVVTDLVAAGFQALAVDVDRPGRVDAGLLGQIDDVLTRLGDEGWSRDQVGVVGFGPGGRAALVVAAHRVLGA